MHVRIRIDKIIHNTYEFFRIEISPPLHTPHPPRSDFSTPRHVHIYYYKYIYIFSPPPPPPHRLMYVVRRPFERTDHVVSLDLNSVSCSSRANVPIAIVNFSNRFTLCSFGPNYPNSQRNPIRLRRVELRFSQFIVFAARRIFVSHRPGNNTRDPVIRGMTIK